MLNSYYSLFVCYDYIRRLSHDTRLTSDVWCRVNIIINIVKCIIALIIPQFILGSDQWYVCLKCAISIMKYSAAFLQSVTLLCCVAELSCHFHQTQRDRRGKHFKLSRCISVYGPMLQNLWINPSFIGGPELALIKSEYPHHVIRKLFER